MRRRAAQSRSVLPDPLFGSELVAKFINVVMLEGKKSLAEAIVYDALQEVVNRLAKQSKPKEGEGGEGDKALSVVAGDIRAESKARESALKALEKALENVKPALEVKSRRVGGANYQVPIEVRPRRRMALAMRWIVDYARNRGTKDMFVKLADELVDAVQGRGGAVKKRQDVHRMADANKAFAHFRW